MIDSRRQFIRKIAAGMALTAIGPQTIAREWFKSFDLQSKPWIELSRSAYLYNAKQISQMANGKPIVGVLKNNAYGLGAVEVAQILNESPYLGTIAVVKDDVAIAMREAQVAKPILLMADFDMSLASELVNQGIILSVHSRNSLDKIKKVAEASNQEIKVALYIDTGLGRMGIPYDQVVALASEADAHTNLRITQTFSTLTTPDDFANEQIDRFDAITAELKRLGIDTGLEHLAPSYSMLELPDSHKDAVRPGILLHGSYPTQDRAEAATHPLQIPYRLKAPIVRLEKLKAGDTIGFSRFYKVEKEEWIATLPIGWADGYYSGAENGAKVMLKGELYPVVNVNASHANISLGSSTDLQVGDVATLIGPDRAEITPEGFGKLTNGHNYLQINYKESITKKVHETF